MSSHRDPGAQPAPHVPSPQHQRAEQGGATDESIQQVHAILKRRLAAERRRFG